MKRLLILSATMLLLLCTFTACVNECNHEYGGWSWSAETEAQCETDGTRVWECDGCDYVKRETIPATGHSYNEWYIAISAGCTTAGKEARDCSKCDHKEEKPIEAHGHKPYFFNDGYDAQCTKTGLTNTEKCSICHEIITKSKTIPALGHDFVDGYCTRCLMPYGTSEGLEYSKTEDGTWSVIGIGSCTDKYVVIPSTYLGTPVTSIGRYAFSYKDIEDIYIPDSITCIDDFAFYSCSSLTSVTIPNSVTSIGISTFSKCTSLTEITLPFIGNELDGENTYFSYIFGAENYYSITVNDSPYVPLSLKNVVITGNITTVYENAFYNCSSLTTITLPDSVTVIEKNAFHNCSSLTSITLPNSVTTIEEEAFRNCSSLTSINIPKYARTVDNDAFYGCYSLIEIINSSSLNITLGEGIAKYAIEVHKGESKIVTWDGYIFYPYENVTYYVKRIDSEKPLLPESYNGISYGIAPYAFYNSGIKEVELPANITHIGRYAFYKTGITSITIPDSVTSIGDSTFSECWALTSITIPDSVTKIGYGAFELCTSLQNISLPFTGESNNATEDNAKFNFIFGDYSIPSSLNNVTITTGKTVYKRAFSGCYRINSVTLPETIIKIEDYAFEGCTNLKSINLPSNLTSIGVSAFENCSSLTSVEIDSNVTSIGLGAFSGCSSLNEIILPYVGNTDNCMENYWLGYIFGATNYTSNSSSVPKSLKKVEITDTKEIPSLAFYGCDNITEIIISDSVDSIGVSALYGCNSLNTLTIPFVGGSRTENNYLDYLFGTDYTSVAPESLKKVILTGSSYANFSGCEYIENIILPESVTKIDIENCSSLKSIHLPKNVNNIGYLNGLLSIEEFTVDADNSSYSAIGGVLYNKAVTELQHYPSAKADPIFVVPNGVTSIFDYFNNCKNLLEIVIPASVTSMYRINAPLLTKITVLSGNEYYRSINGNLYSADGKTLISVAKGKTEVTLAHGITTISIGLFADSCVTTIVIPDSVTTIEASAFSNCKNLTSVYISSNVTTIGLNAFNNCSNATIYCEALSQPTGWYSSWNSGCKEVVWGYIKE